MRKLLVVLLLAGFATSTISCEEDDLDLFEDEVSLNCNCGIIKDDGIENGRYWVTIKSECSGNIKKFYLSRSDWMEAYVGTNLCITTSGGW